MKTTLLLISAVILHAVASAQCLVYEVPLSARVQQAEAIFEGKVIAKKSFWNKQHNYIYTANTVEVYKIFKGNFTTDKTEIITPGGVVGDKAIVAEPALKLSRGETGIFFANFNHANLPVTGTIMKPLAGPQSFIQYNIAENSAADIFATYQGITSNLYKKIAALTKTNYQTVHPFNVDIASEESGRSAPVVTNLNPLSLSAGTKTAVTISGSGFGATQGNGHVSFKNSDNGGGSVVNVTDPKYYISWSDNTIQVIVPGDVMANAVGTGTVTVTNNSAQSGTGSQTLTVTFNRYEIAVGSTLEQTFFYNDNSSGGYTFAPHTEVAALPAVTDAIQRAMDTWTCAANVNWNLSSTPTTIDVVASDGINVIRFDNGSELGAGILGVGSTYWSYTFGTMENYWKVTEMDITLDDGTNWNYGPGTCGGAQYDLESVMLHELGHLHQFNHVINTSSTMNYAIANGAMKRTLLSSDITGASLVMNASGTDASDAGISAMIPYTNNPNCIPTSIENSSGNAASQPIYPNPATDFIRVKFNKDSKVEVFNLIGESFEVIIAGDNLIDISSLSRGIYVLKISDSYSSSAYRFSVAK
jgi:hypothetical protein